MTRLLHQGVRLPLLVGLVLALSVSGCSLWDRFFADETQRSAAELMSEGMEQFQKGYYEDAAEAFQKVKDRYPYSRYAIEAELKMADALYRQELFDEAYDAYHEFERLHPKNPNIPYVIYQKGMCHFSRVSTIDRDQSHTLRAKEEFERLVEKFPDDEYAAKARGKLRQCYISLAEYELYVGHFYFKNENYRAAINRYQYVLENYPDLGQYHEALEYLRRAKQKRAEREEGE